MYLLNQLILLHFGCFPWFKIQFVYRLGLDESMRLQQMLVLYYFLFLTFYGSVYILKHGSVTVQSLRIDGEHQTKEMNFLLNQDHFSLYDNMFIYQTSACICFILCVIYLFSFISGFITDQSSYWKIRTYLSSMEEIRFSIFCDSSCDSFLLGRSFYNNDAEFKITGNTVLPKCYSILKASTCMQLSTIYEILRGGVFII